jgi:hypothetical protein
MGARPLTNPIALPPPNVVHEYQNKACEKDTCYNVNSPEPAALFYHGSPSHNEYPPTDAARD